MPNREFDKRLREMLESSIEEPSSSLWLSIEKSLELKSRRAKRVLYFKRGSIALSAVAASLLLFLLLFNERESELKLYSSRVVSQVVVAPPSKIVVESLSREIAPLEIESKRALKGREESVTIERDDQEQVRVDEKEQHTTKREEQRATANYPELVEYNSSQKRASPMVIAFATNLSPSTGSKSVSLMSMSQSNEGITPDNVVSTIQKSTVPKEVISNSKHLMPISIGVEGQLPLSRVLSLGVGLNYTMLFSNYDLISREEIHQTQQTLHYIGVPLNLYATLYNNEKFKLYLNGGVALEKGLYGFYRVSKNGLASSYGKSIEGIQLSAAAGLGLELVVNSFTGLYFDPTFAYYFENHQPFSIRTAQPLQFKFEVGFRFHL